MRAECLRKNTPVSLPLEEKALKTATLLTFLPALLIPHSLTVLSGTISQIHYLHPNPCLGGGEEEKLRTSKTEGRSQRRISRLQDRPQEGTLLDCQVEDLSNQSPAFPGVRSSQYLFSVRQSFSQYVEGIEFCSLCNRVSLIDCLSLGFLKSSWGVQNPAALEAN